MKFVVCGNYGAKNRGDEMILEGILKSLKSIDPQAEITVLSGNPEETSLKYKVRSFKMFPSGIRSRLSSLFSPCSGAYQALKKCDYFVLGGGGLFTNLTLRAYIIWNCQAKQALKMGKKIIMYGQSLGPVEGRLQEKIVKNLFNNAHSIFLRDQASIEELSRLGITKKAYLMPDLALRIESESQSGTQTIVAPHYFKKLPENFKLIDFIKSHNAEVINFQEQDKKISQMGDANPSTKDIEQKYKDANIIVGIRLHSIICAVKFGKAFIAFNYSPKVRNFVKEVGLESQVLEMDEFEKLEDLYQKTLANQNQIIAKIEDYKQKAKKSFSENEAILKSLL
jgi:polysaccharide pyruvyl transferase CsaB